MKSLRFVPFVSCVLGSLAVATAAGPEVAYTVEGTLTRVAYPPAGTITNRFEFSAAVSNRVWRIEVLPLDADWHYKRAFMASDGRTLYSLTHHAQPPFTASALDTEIPPGVRLEFSALWVALAQNCVAASADAQGFDCFDPFTPRDRFVMTRVRAVTPRDAFGLPEFASYHSYAAGPEANGLDRPNLGRTNAVYQVLERSRAGERKRLPKRFTLALLNPEDPERKWYEFMAVATNTVVGFSAPSVIPSLPPGEAVQFVDVRYDNWTDGVFLRITNDWPSKASVQARPEYAKWEAGHPYKPKFSLGRAVLLAAILLIGLAIVPWWRRRKPGLAGGS